MRTTLSTSALLYVALFAISVAPAPCNVTLGPSITVGTDLQAVLDNAIEPYPLTVCLAAGNFTGCTGNSLTTAAGGGLAVHLRGVGETATRVDCALAPSFVSVTSNGSSISNMTILDIGGTMISVSASDVSIAGVKFHNGNEAGTAVALTSGSLTLVRCHITSFDKQNTIRMYGGSLSLIQVTFDSCSSDLITGAIYASGGEGIFIAGCSFLNNFASVHGGTIYSNVPVTALNSSFVGNRALDAGGAIYMQGSDSLFVSNCHFRDNTASTDGGAIYTPGGTATVVDSTFANCRSPDGGAVYVYASSSTWNNVSIVDCVASGGNGGGMATVSGSVLTLVDVIISGCGAALGDGGGLFMSSVTSVEASRLTVAGCVASTGSAVYTRGQFACESCLFTANSVNNGAIVYSTIDGQLTLSQTTVSDNTATSTYFAAVHVAVNNPNNQEFYNSTFSCGSEGEARLLSVPATGLSAVIIDGCDFPEYGGVSSEMVLLETVSVAITNTRASINTIAENYIRVNSATSFRMSNTSLEGEGGTATGIRVDGGADNEMEDCYFRNMYETMLVWGGLHRLSRLSVCESGRTVAAYGTADVTDSEFIETSATALFADEMNSFKVTNNRFVNNTASSGAAISLFRPAAELHNNVFVGGYATGTGSAVNAYGMFVGSVTLLNSTFLNMRGGSSVVTLSLWDWVVARNLVFGGGNAGSNLALSASAQDTSVSNITVASSVGVCGVQLSGSSTATLSGVHMDNVRFCSTGAATISTSGTISDVTVRDSSGEFVGVKATGSSTVDITRVHVSDSPGDSASVVCSGPTCNVRDVAVSGASMAGDDGVVVSENSGVLVGVNITVVDSGSTCVKVDSDATATLRDSLFSGCSAESGAGVYIDSGSASFTNCVFTDNTATVGGVGTAAGSGVSLSFSACELVGNFAPTTGAALMCYSGAACSTSYGTVVTDNSGSDAIYALFLATLDIRSTVLARNSNDAVASYGAAAVNITDSTIHGNSGGAVNSVSSPLRLEGTVIHDNSGAYAVRLYGCSDVSMISSFVSSNSGTGLSCSQPTADFVGVWNESVVCDNEVDYGCVGGCDFGGAAAAAGVCSTNSTSCGSYCASDTDYCVAAGAGFVGPYNGCPVCGGPCNTGSFSCPNSSVCTDAVGGGYDCICPTGFVGNGSQPCSDADECALGTDNCSPLANCTNTPGSFTCTCERGYSGNGVTCSDIDECGDGSHDCVVNAVCTNVAGSHECECDDTSYGDGRVECRPCPANSHSFVGATNVTDCECDTNTFNIDNTVGGDCGPCPVGRYVTDAGGVLVCIACPADSYSDSPNTGGACTACPTSTTTNGVEGANSVLNCTCAEGLALVVVGGTNGTAQCERYCPAGTSRPDSDSQCVDCPIGRYSDQPNQEECLPCPLNSLTAGVASTSVANCSCVSGYAAPGGAVGVDCERQCPPGSYRPAPFGLDCPVCDIGSFSDEPNVDECTPCPANAVTPSVNSTAVTDCECPPNYYTPERERGTECQPCPSGAKCKGGVSWPVARKGYIYVEDEDGTAGFAECVPFEACAGNGQCADGYTGELCERCKPNYYRLDGLCYECQNNAWLIVLACGLGLFLFCAVLVWFNSQDRAINKFASMVIGVNALQIAGMYGRLNLNWPPLAQKFFAVLSLVNFNIELVSPECAVSVNDPFVLRWLMTMGFPILVIAIFASIAGIGSLLMMCTCCGLYDPEVSKWNPRYLRHTCIRAFYQLMTIGYLPLSAAVFEFFYCVKDASGDMVISTARQTKCYTPTYWSLFPVALLCSLLYPIGVPLCCGFLLQTKRQKLGVFKFGLRYGFLVGRFAGEYYYFELVVMARKLGVALAMTFLTDNPYVKAAGAVVVLAVALTVHLRLAPYRTRLYNALESACLALSVFILLVSVTFQAAAAETLTRAVVVVFLLTTLVLTILAGLVIDATAVFRAEQELERDAQAVEHVDYRTDGDVAARETEFEAFKHTATMVDTYGMDTGSTSVASRVSVGSSSGGGGSRSGVGYSMGGASDAFKSTAGIYGTRGGGDGGGDSSVTMSDLATQ